MNTIHLLHAAGLRKTEARGVVLELLSRTDRPLSHQEITENPATRGMDRVTLYRTLTTLLKAGLLHRVQGVDGVCRFRSDTGRACGDHIHFLCLQCRQMQCLLEKRTPWIEAPDGAEVFGEQVVIYGRCAKCNTQNRVSNL